MDLTFSNSSISNFFNGNNSYVPTGELLYVQSHYLSNSFLSELEVLISKTSQTLLEKVDKGRYESAFLTALAQLGEIVPDINEKTAEKVLFILRDIYRICNEINA